MRGIPDDQLTVNGTLKVVYERDVPDEYGQANFAVGPEAFKAILEGYACGNCLAYRSFRGFWQPRCPTCDVPTGANRQQITSEWWLENPPKCRP